MPWFPDFVAAVELARWETRTAGLDDPVAQYLKALTRGDAAALETAWPGEVVIDDPNAGEVRGHWHLRRFVRRSQAWLADHDARSERVASTRVGTRAVVELMAHVTPHDEEVCWPAAVVAESPDDRNVVFRIYASQWPFTDTRPLRPPILAPGSAGPDDVVGRFLAALDAGDVDGMVQTFEPDGYLREPIGSESLHRGSAELRGFFERCFGHGGGLHLEACCVTDDGERCAVEYNCIAWAGHELSPQAGVVVFERGTDGLLAAARFYDDVQPAAAPA
jgi:hypothetical protein